MLIKYRRSRARYVKAQAPQECGSATSNLAAEKRRCWQDIWSQSLRDPLAYRLQDIRDLGLNESLHEMPCLF
jgi:hypothetical protein